MNMMNLKNKVANKRAAIVASATSAVAMASQAFCFNAQLNKIIALIWTLTTFTGIAMCAIGIVQVIRCVIALTGGDQLQPGQLGKAIGLIAAGLCAAMLETVLGAIGVPTTV